MQLTTTHWAGLACVLTLCGLGYASWQSGQPTQPAVAGSNPDLKSLPAEASQTSGASQDAPVGLPSRPAGVIEALQQQVANSPVLREAGADRELLSSLDQARSLLAESQERNRLALKRLNRQLRVGAARRSPNVLLILFDELGRAGGKELPCLQALAARGCTFTNYYAGGADVETGWWTLMTGRNSGRARQSETGVCELREDDDTLLQRLWQAGYETASIGPWMGRAHPLDSGCDHWAGWLSGRQPLAPFPVEIMSGRTVMRIPANQGGQQQASLWELLRAEVTAYLRRPSDSRQPFFLQVRLPKLSRVQAPVQDWDETLRAMLDELESLQLEQETCVVITALTGDNSQSQHELSEQRLQAPLFIYQPGDGAQRQTVTPVCAAWDLMPTLLDLAEAQRRPANLDGRSLRPALNRRPLTEPALLYWRSATSQAVRQGRWKAVYSSGDRKLRLYDLQEDPEETTDVAGEHPDVVRQLIVDPPADGKSVRSGIIVPAVTDRRLIGERHSPSKTGLVIAR